ncbi:hypothetical protein KSP40_PGU003333 [Platanthera guangdongensis]|uniref:Uncharacterized protein n=1 Tax=Platanthera guangdongensis TaxID=2320717 RepID=A0ABR2M4X0_9ASPA
MEDPRPTNAEEIEDNPNSNTKSSPASVWDCGSPLYDSYELVSFCHVLDCHMMTLPYSFTENFARFERTDMIPDDLEAGKWKKKKEEEDKDDDA